MKNILIAIFLLSTLIIAGCGEKECETRADCTAKGACFIGNCVKGTCEYRERPGCTCGNDRCEEDLGENECTCTDDCGTCKGNVGEYMEKSCIGDQCVTSVKGLESRSAEDTISYESNRVKIMEMALKATYDEPFNIKASLFSINLKIDKITDAASDVKITKIKLVEHTGTKDRRGNWVNDDPVTLAEKEYTKTLFDQTSTFNKAFPVFLENIDPDTNSEKTVTIEVSYSLKTKDRYGNPVDNTAVFEKEISMNFINPSIEQKCPDNCNDNNPCTQDRCDSTTDYFCENKIIQRGICCGDDVCSPGEDRCKCPTDCGICTGAVGDYMSMGCSAANTCTFQLLNPNIIQPTSKLADADFSGATASLTVVYDIPFNKQSSIFRFSFEPKTFTNVKDVVIQKVTFLDKSGTILGQQTLNMPLVEGQTSTAQAALAYSTLNPEEEKTVSAKFDYSAQTFNAKSGDWSTTVTSYTYTVGDLMILNPG